MNRFWKSIFLIIIISLPLVFLLFHIDSQKKENKNTLKEFTEQPQKQPTITISDVSKEPLISREEIDPLCSTCTSSIEENPHILQQAGWIPPWDYKNGLESLNRFESQFNSVSPVTFQINNDGSLTQRLDPNLADLKKIAREKDVKIIPTISNFDSNMMKNIFDSPENTQRHINSIIEVVRKYQYDGIDLDYESLQPSNKDHFLDFVKTLSTELKKDNKILSVTVLPKWGEDVVYTAFPGTRNVQDWEIIGQWADEVRIMAYDFTPVSSSTEGPIAPISWVENILEYAVEKIPREKIWLGTHLYSYEWVMPTRDSKEMKVRTNSYTYNVVKSRILIHDYVDVKYNDEYEEGYAEYNCLENYFCILFYATPESVQKRKEIAQKYEIAGVTYWRFGGEGELIR